MKEKNIHTAYKQRERLTVIGHMPIIDIFKCTRPKSEKSHGSKFLFIGTSLYRNLLTFEFEKREQLFSNIQATKRGEEVYYCGYQKENCYQSNCMQSCNGCPNSKFFTDKTHSYSSSRRCT